MTGKTPTQSAPAGAPDDEINLLEAVYALVKYKLVIALLAAAGLAGGYAAARAKGPSYVAAAAIVAKESDKQASPLSALGALGTLAAGQLNLAANPGLEKIEIHFDSRQFKGELIEKYGLLDDIYRYGLPRAYRKYYDTAGGRWLESEKFPVPEPMKAAEFFGRKFFRKEVDTKKGVLTLSVTSSDSVFTSRVIEGTLEHLDRYIRTSVQQEAKANVDFLEKQLITVADPLLREKLQGMIATEIEKAMLVSREAFKVVDRPFCVKRYRERIFYPAAGAAGMFLFGCAAVIILYYVMGGGNTNSESRKWVGLIRRELFRII